MISIFIIAVLIGCNSLEGVCDRGERALVEIEEETTQNLMFVTNEDCMPPCWHGLTPGETTEESVLNTLEITPFVFEPSITIAESTIPARSIITWQGSKNGLGTPILRGRHHILSDVLVYTEIEIGYQVTVQEAIDLLGEPDLYAISPTSTGDSCTYWARLLWSDIGFLVSLFGQSEDTLTSEMLIKRMMYFEAGNDASAYLIANSGTDEDINERGMIFDPWDGFESSD